MTAPKSPSDDAEFLPLPPGVEVRHRVGGDAKLLAELAPLLADEGIDVDRWHEADPQELHAALTRAIERHNLAASTPVGDQRVRTVNTLRELLTALASRDTAAAQVLFAAIGPVPTRHRPSSGHLTGVIVETLDGLYRSDALLEHLQVVTIPRVDDLTETVARQLLELAAQGDAFRRLDTLLAEHGGFEVSRAGLYVLASVIDAVAHQQDRAFITVLDELLPAAVGDESSPQPATETTEQAYVQDFFAWLSAREDVANYASKISVIFSAMLQDAHREHINPHDPAHFDTWMMAVLANTPPQYVSTALEIVNYYLEFRLRTGLEPERWHAAHTKITDMTVNQQAAPWDFEEIYDAAQHVAAPDRHAALLDLHLVSGVWVLIEWLAQPRPVTDTGVPLVEDIRRLAAMIGVNAHGVAELQGDEPDAYVDSALSVPELMMWWWALEELNILRVTEEIVALGALGIELVEAEQLSIELAEQLVGVYLKIFLIHGLDQAPLEVSAVGHTLGRLLNSLAGMPPAAEASPDDFRGQLVQKRSDGYLRSLHAVGLLEGDLRTPRIPEPLQAAVFYGLMMAMDYIDEFLDDNFS